MPGCERFKTLPGCSVYELLQLAPGFSGDVLVLYVKLRPFTGCRVVGRGATAVRVHGTVFIVVLLEVWAVGHRFRILVARYGSRLGKPPFSQVVVGDAMYLHCSATGEDLVGVSRSPS